MGTITSLAAERVRRGEGIEISATDSGVLLRVAGWELVLSPEVAADIAELLGECALDCGARELERRGKDR